MRVRRKTDDYLAHHGVKGQKWGVRRYQNADGSLTADGRKHYGYSDKSDVKKTKKEGTVSKNKIVGKDYSLYNKYMNDLVDFNADYIDIHRYSKEKQAENTSEFKKTYTNYLKEKNSGTDSVDALKNILNTKVMKDFLNDEVVKQTYKDRNKYLNSINLSQADSEYTTGKIYYQELRRHISNFFGSQVNDKNGTFSNGTCLQNIIEDMDSWDNDGDLSPYPNEYSWLWWH